MTYENILTEKENGIAVVTINRPSKLNALNKATIDELHHTFGALEHDADVKVIIVTGSGGESLRGRRRHFGIRQLLGRKRNGFSC